MNTKRQFSADTEAVGTAIKVSAIKAFRYATRNIIVPFC